MKEIRGEHCKTPNATCGSELARQPCRTKVITASINYLDHVISSKDTLFHDILKATWKSNVWIRNIISCINRLGFSFLNEIMPTTSFKPFINQIQQRIYDQNLQDQNSKIRECEKLSFLRNIYDENIYDVDNIILKSDRSNIAKLRMCAHNLEIEKGRYFQINRTERFCKICNDLEIEDENHFLWQCEKYRKEREILFKKVSLFYTSVDTEKCCPKGMCGCQYFISLTLKKNKFMDTGVLDFF